MRSVMSIIQNHFYSINAMQGHIRTISCESMPFHANAYICGINWTNTGEARQRWGRPASSSPQWLQKRGLGEPGDETWQLNSVPFMGKRTMEKGQEGLGQGDLMIRVPREETEDEEATNPWQFMILDPRRVSRS